MNKPVTFPDVVRPIGKRVVRLKCWPEHYEPIWAGFKKAEVRENDRDYQTGDWLMLQKYLPKPVGEYTGEFMMVRVTHILTSEQIESVHSVRLDKKIVVLSIEPLEACRHCFSLGIADSLSDADGELPMVTCERCCGAGYF